MTPNLKMAERSLGLLQQERQDIMDYLRRMIALLQKQIEIEGRIVLPSRGSNVGMLKGLQETLTQIESGKL